MISPSPSTRKLRNPPLVEAIFEVRWTHSTPHALYEEFELSLGQLFPRVRGKFPHRSTPSERPPRELFMLGFARGAVFERFMQKTPENGRLEYPLLQYGPGIGSVNFDGPSYDSARLKTEAFSYFHDLISTHEGLEKRIETVSFRALDLLPIQPGTKPNDFMSTNLAMQVTSGIDMLPALVGGIRTPAYACSWVAGDALLAVTARLGSALGREGIILDFKAETSGATVVKDGIEQVVQRLHKLAGDAFFALLTKEYLDELRNGH